MKQHLITLILMAFLPSAYALDSINQGPADLAAASTVAGSFSTSTISSGTEHACVIDDTGVVCWGSNGYGQTDVPLLINPVQVSAGNSHTCAIDGNGVVCWGQNSLGQTDVPPLSNPVAVHALSGRHARTTCAIDDTGVVCWGDLGEYDNYVLPQLSNPTAISGKNYYNLCAIDDTGVVCWFEQGRNLADVPQLTNPVALAVGEAHACVIDNTGVVCWGDDSNGQTDVPPLSNPVAISSAEDDTCAIDDTGVVCWGQNSLGQTDVPPLSNPVAISTNNPLRAAPYTCAIDDTGVVCWGINFSGQTDVPQLTFTRGIAISAPARSECTLPNAAIVQVEALVTEIPNDPSILMEWFLNDDSLGYGDSIDFTAPLGVSGLKLEVIRASGTVISKSQAIIVEDTKKPKLSTLFTDDKGNKISKDELNHAKRVFFAHSATDKCDPDVVSAGITRSQDPVVELKLLESEGEIRFKSEEFFIRVTAEDASGNQRRRKINIPISSDE
jgi:hypothetical protein